MLAKAGVELIPHRATLLDPHTVEVDGGKITADKILIAVGGRPVKPDLQFGLAEKVIFPDRGHRDTGTGWYRRV
ncbi:hypothetical protein A2T98_03990 [Nodularia spumigena CENA596]|uniref:FAD/NAD(P)-binding domain-containing protein n=1 Tax=Nodularia spumigena CENA596 TaxID=1819295 RepID=A0A161XMM7_NODSP|nr:hypothetical protein A2T98_03990 [Nodularia spumigena CENA596]